MLFLILVWRLAVRAWRHAPNEWGRILGLGLLGSVAAFSAHSLVDSLFVHSIGILLGILLGLLSAMGQPEFWQDLTPASTGEEPKLHSGAVENAR